MKDFILSPKLSWGIALVLFAITCYLYLHPRTVEVEKVVEKEVIKEVIVAKNETVGTVAHKMQTTDPDIVYNTKQTLDVSVNGKVVNLTPKDSEKFEFGKDYLKLDQQSIYTISIDNKPLEPTFGLGIGYSNNKKLTGIATIRIKKTPFQVWGMTDGKTRAVGVMANMNYK